MITRFSKITPKDIQQLQGIDSYEAARRYIVGIRQALNCPDILLCHLASYWRVTETELIASLSGKKSA
jgi:hypothetical protein